MHVQQQADNDVALGAAAGTLGLDNRSGIEAAADGPQAIADGGEVAGSALRIREALYLLLLG